MISKEQLLALSKTQKVHTVTIKEWGDFGIRIMSGTERETYDNQIFVDGKISLTQFRAKLLCKVLCDADGNRMFTDDDLAAITALPAPVLSGLFEVAKTLNALTPEDVDELTKN